MRDIIKAVGFSSLLALSTGVSAVTVNGVSWIPEDFTEMDSGAFAQNFNAVSGELTGWGVVTGFNNDVITDICPACELTYSFNGFVLDDANSSLNRLRFTGGTVEFFTDVPGDFDIESQASAENGTSWMTIEGHEFLDILNAPPFTTTTLTANLTSGQLMFDTLTGPAAQYFDTDSISDSLGGFADFGGSSSVVTYYTNGTAGDTTGNNDIAATDFALSVITTAAGLGIDPNDITVDVGDFFVNIMGLNNVVATGSLDLRGQSVPEPMAVYMMGLGLLGFAVAKRSKKT